MAQSHLHNFHWRGVLQGVEGLYIPTLVIGGHLEYMAYSCAVDVEGSYIPMVTGGHLEYMVWRLAVNEEMVGRWDKKELKQQL